MARRRPSPRPSSRPAVCHYCGQRATTEDHIVPRASLPSPLSQLPYWFRQHFTVPACLQCNGYKSYFRSTCTCEQCEWVWETALALFIPSGHVPHGPLQVPAPAPSSPAAARPLSKNQRRRQQAEQRRQQTASTSPADPSRMSS